MSKYYEYFYGNKISDYGLENGYIDYGCLASCFQHVLANDLYAMTDWVVGNWELVSGCDYDEEDDSYSEIFQYYVVSSNAVELLREANEIVYYNEALNMYLWGVTHYGTSWDYVLTDIPCTEREE